MPYYGSIQVQDRYGWTKTFRLEKALVMVGSAPVNDIVLPSEHGDGVLPVHLQLFHPQPDLVEVRAVNLTNSVIPLTRVNPSAAAGISANAYQNLESGDALQVGQFTLALSLQSGEGFSRSERSEHLGLKLELPTPILRAEKQLEGLLTINNFGLQKRCQFEIDLEGLPSDCYQIDPAPLLYPNGEEQLRIRFFHRGTRPGAGTGPVTLRMTAAGAYPTEEVVLSFNLEVAPVYQTDMLVLDDKETPSEWVIAPISTVFPAMPAPESAVIAPQPPNTAKQNQPLESSMPETIEPNPAPTDQPVPDNVVITEQPSRQAQLAETEGDWWSDEHAPQGIAPAFNAYRRRTSSHKPRLAPNQNIQVLRGPGVPASGGEGEPTPQPENNEHTA